MHDSVTVHMQAPADRIFELVSDVTRIGEFSPETFEAEWLDGATGPAVGARFKGHVKRNGRGPVYWTNCKITACDPGTEFTFSVSGPGDRVAQSSRRSAEMNASWGISTRPIDFMRFLPSFCFSSSLRFRVMSPP
jgi:hypothetical protein